MKGLAVSVIAPDLSGGGMTRAYWLGLLLANLGHEVRVLGSSLVGDGVYPTPPKGLPVVQVPGRSIARVVASVAALRGDVVYAIKPRPTSFGIALLGNLMRRRRLLLDMDDWEEGLMQEKPERRSRAFSGWLRPDDRRAMARLERWIPRVDGLTVNSTFLRDLYGGTLLPSGKDTALFDPALHDPEESRKKLGLGGRVVLMFPGTPRPHKGLDDLVLAIERLGRKEVVLALVGGHRSRYVDELATRLPRHVAVLPRFAYDEMPSVVSAAQVVVVPQRDSPAARGQCPMKLTDGMAMAKPILSTRVGEIPSVLGDTGFLVDPGSPDQLAERLEWILDHEAEAKSQGLRARARCVEKFSLRALSPVLEGVLREPGTRD
jgi:glycosyltransferase involved in cell wall biosynthesis